MTVSAGLALLHIFGVLIAAPVLPWAATASFALLLIYVAMPAGPAIDGDSRSLPLLVATAVLVVHAAATMPPASHGARALQWTPMLGNGEPEPLGVIGERVFRDACLALLVVTLLLAAVAGRGGAPRRRALMAGGTAVLLLTGYAAVRIVDVSVRTAEEAARSPARLGATVALVVAVPLAAGLVAVTVGMLSAQWSRTAMTGAALLAVASVGRMDAALSSLPLPYGVVAGNPLFSWTAVPFTSPVPGVVDAVRTGLEFAGILLVAAGVSHRAANGRVGEVQ
ncbi:hypothetical protein [Actinoplanes sp. NPDC049681]|uniref:hypothetical protein n=1 Tax=Actinoplanes sp. NPDC049681 TaxID=3363905 RepID=UPI0037A02F78